MPGDTVPFEFGKNIPPSKDPEEKAHVDWSQRNAEAVITSKRERDEREATKEAAETLINFRPTKRARAPNMAAATKVKDEEFTAKYIKDLKDIASRALDKFLERMSDIKTRNDARVRDAELKNLNKIMVMTEDIVDAWIIENNIDDNDYKRISNALKIPQPLSPQHKISGAFMTEHLYKLYVALFKRVHPDKEPPFESPHVRITKEYDNAPLVYLAHLLHTCKSDEIESNPYFPRVYPYEVITPKLVQDEFDTPSCTVAPADVKPLAINPLAARKKSKKSKKEKAKCEYTYKCKSHKKKKNMELCTHTYKCPTKKSKNPKNPKLGKCNYTYECEPHKKKQLCKYTYKCGKKESKSYDYLVTKMKKKA
tara:strand:- start:125 stop:1225 length:1101 start_codon:yes stop_codon:yes gene_type:complete